MKTLPINTDFRARGEAGWTFRIVERIGDVALVRKTHPEASRPAWEVAIIQRHDAYKIGDKMIEAGESLPPATAFGVKAWAPASEKAARERLDDVAALRSDIACPAGTGAGRGEG